MINFCFGFLTGLIVGIAIYMTISLLIYKRYTKKRKEQLKNLVQDGKKAAADMNTVTERLNKVRDIIDQQQAIRMQVEFPQRSAIDGKHKNNLIHQAKSLEEEKFVILNSILKDGFDPLIAAVDENGAVKEMKLSEFVNEAPKPEVEEPKLPPNARKVGKFVVYSNAGDGEGTTN